MDAELAQALLSEAKSEQAAIVDLRRTLHRYPELELELPRTQKVIVDALAALNLSPVPGNSCSSVVAVIEGTSPGPTTLLRADMDALAMPEDTGLPFASEIPGRMHACGHDGHVAMLVGAARLLVSHRHLLAGKVILMFQPGEEGAGGASRMIEEGLLHNFGRVDRAFALHVNPGFPSGSITTRVGTFMASADEFTLIVKGKGGHASMPHDAIDPVPAAAEIITSLQTMVTRRVPAFDPAVITVTKISAGTAFNVIPESVSLAGTFRTVSEESRSLVHSIIRETSINIARAHSCTVEILPEKVSYPVTVNDGAEATRTLAVARLLVGTQSVFEAPSPVMGAEDWSYVLQQVPGAMAFLGVAPEGIENPASIHSNRMILNENALPVGVALHAAMALDD